MPDGAAGARAGVDTVSVAQVLASPELVGRTVVVGGRCLGYGTIKAAGTSPMTRSDWQLEDQDAAIWVTGPMPEGTSPTQGSAAWVHIRARVAADTIRSLGGDGEKARRYLVHLPG
jgi:hypothetical protein